MSRTRIKICGVTCPEDALVAAQFGADAVGMVFHRASGRNVRLEVAEQIVQVLPPFVTPVAVFVNADRDAIHQTCLELGVRHVQLSGDEDPELVAELEGFTVTKAIRVAADTFAETLDTWRDFGVAGLILETLSDKPGGSGQPNNWPFIFKQYDGGAFGDAPPIIAAGGLRTGTVGEVVRHLRPYAVDVSSGVEEKPGKKSAVKIRDFIRSVRDADAS